MGQPAFRLLPELKMGPVCLRTKDLESMLSFYQEDCELQTLRSEGDYTILGSSATSDPILILHHDDKASSPPPNETGLYHYALLVPDRAALATAYLGLGGKGIVFDGYADHQVSEALYLTDPEGNGIEIYTDRPRDKWVFDEGGVQMTTQPLDLDSLIQERPPERKEYSKTIADGTRIGHIHLKVADLQTSVAFYRDGLGFELMRFWGNAAFLSAGGYHHHIGMNTWESLGGPSTRKSWTGLEYFEAKIPRSELNELSTRVASSSGLQMGDSGRLFVADPDEINIIFTA